MSTIATQSDNHAAPEYLQSYDALAQHFRANLDGLSTVEKGRRFARFVQRLVPQTELGRVFDTPELNEKESHDEGIDLTAQGKDGRSVLHVQAKLWIDRAEALDGILSKFHNFSRASTRKQGDLFGSNEVSRHFLIATLSPLESLIHRYSTREFGSRPFYDRLVESSRLTFCDGVKILTTLGAAYDKLAELPSRIVLNLETDAIVKDSVYLGIITGTELRALYTDLGDSLFFENIRDFVGIPSHLRERGRSSPNNEIIKTIRNCPDRMLERNNGIVLRADDVCWGDSRRQLVLNRGSVVNGCQTTMCLVTAGVDGDKCSVPIKVVKTTDSWSIAKAANYQNAVPDIDLDLARHVRPQLAKRAAARVGVQLRAGERSAFEIIDTIYDQRIAYDETRALYIGLFSKTPNNVFAGNYTELLAELIDRFYQEDPFGESTFGTMFLVQAAAQEAIDKAQLTLTNPVYAGLFERIYKEDNPSYRCFVSILALCGATKTNIADRKSDAAAEYDRMRTFLESVRTLLESRKDGFVRYYLHAAKLWMQQVMPRDADDAEIRRDMSVLSRRINFTHVYRMLCMEADVDEHLRTGGGEQPDRG